MRIEQPSKIIAVHLNYHSRAAERGKTPATPSYFLKSPSTLSSDGRDVVRPPDCELLASEGEIALVLADVPHDVDPGDAWSFVRYVTAANDFGVYDLRYADPGSNVHSKGFDGFTPVGPALLAAAELDPVRLRVRSWVNGNLVQDAGNDDLIFDCPFVIADLSRVMSLGSGDLVLMGTPTGSSVVMPGAVVEVEVSAGDAVTTGRLRNTIVASPGRFPSVGAMPRVDDATRAAAFGVSRL